MDYCHYRRMREIASELGVPYLDLFEVFVGRDGAALRISPANEHPNAEGHRLAAERIARFLREDVLLHRAGKTIRSRDAGTLNTIPP